MALPGAPYIHHPSSIIHLPNVFANQSIPRHTNSGRPWLSQGLHHRIPVAPCGAPRAHLLSPYHVSMSLDFTPIHRVHFYRVHFYLGSILPSSFYLQSIRIQWHNLTLSLSLSLRPAAPKNGRTPIDQLNAKTEDTGVGIQSARIRTS